MYSDPISFTIYAFGFGAFSVWLVVSLVKHSASLFNASGMNYAQTR